MGQKGERDCGFRIAELKVSGVGVQVSENESESAEI
jgi:hypothetical protein